MESSGIDQVADTTDMTASVSPFAPDNGVTEAMPDMMDAAEMSAAEASGTVTGVEKTTGEAEAAGVTMADIPEPKLDKAEDKSELENAKKAGPEAKTEEAEAKASTEPAAQEVVQEQPVAQEEVAVVETAAPLSTDVTIEALLEECVNHDSSDLHLQAGLPPTLRIDGTLRPMTTYPILSNDKVKELVFATLDEEQQKILMKDKEIDYSFAFGDLGRFRVNAFHERGNLAAAFRLIPNKIKTLEDLGLPGIVGTFADRPHGLVLVTGPTGSGKSTTLAALIDKINSEKAVHIITIEDPIEFTHHSKRAIVAQREVHYDTFSFAAALRSILREDPDVVLIGEMRDLETIQAAITVAETGHLVFATLHTNSAAQSIDRIIDVFPAHQQSQIRAQLANVLNGICSQRLLPAIEGGRIAVAEILVSNPAVRAIIREGKTHQLDMAIQTGVEQGMQTMDRELVKAVKAGIVSYDTAHEFAVDLPEFERLARGV